MSNQALIIVDMQEGLLAGRHSVEQLLARLEALASRLRARGVPIIFVKHRGPESTPLHPSQPGQAIHRVRRQGIWRRWSRGGEESGLRLGLMFRRRACGESSAAGRWSSA